MRPERSTSATKHKIIISATIVIARGWEETSSGREKSKTSNMEDHSAVQTSSATELSAKAAANEQAKKKNELWFSKFVKYIQVPDKMLKNYWPCTYAIKDGFHKQMWTAASTHVPSLNNKPTKNSSKSLKLLMTHTMQENVGPFLTK